MGLGMSISQLLLLAGPWIYLEMDMAHGGTSGSERLSSSCWPALSPGFLLHPEKSVFSVPNKGSREG